MFSDNFDARRQNYPFPHSSYQFHPPPKQSSLQPLLSLSHLLGFPTLTYADTHQCVVCVCVCEFYTFAWFSILSQSPKFNGI